jgi:hypothetical protein
MEEFDRLNPAGESARSGFFERLSGLFRGPGLVLAGAAAAVLLVFAARLTPERHAAGEAWTVSIESYTVYDADAEG